MAHNFFPHGPSPDVSTLAKLAAYWGDVLARADLLTKMETAIESVVVTTFYVLLSTFYLPHFDFLRFDFLRFTSHYLLPLLSSHFFTSHFLPFHLLPTCYLPTFHLILSSTFHVQPSTLCSLFFLDFSLYSALPCSSPLNFYSFILFFTFLRFPHMKTM